MIYDFLYYFVQISQKLHCYFAKFGVLESLALWLYVTVMPNLVLATAEHSPTSPNLALHGFTLEMGTSVNSS